MKRIFFYLLAGMMMMPMFAQEYVDLGLASGTLWASQPEAECYTYDDAKATFGSHLPTQWQWAELYQSCELEKFFTKEKKGVLFTGINGNSIFVPTEEAVGNPKNTNKAAYWCFSTAPYNTKQAYGVGVGSEQHFFAITKQMKQSVLQVSKTK